MSSTVSNIIIIVIVVAILYFAVKNSLAHFKGEGACCGGGGKGKPIKPKKLDKVIATRVVGIEGMVCDHCSLRVQNALNSVDGINAKVKLSRGTAIVKLGKEISYAVFCLKKKKIENKVKGIE